MQPPYYSSVAYTEPSTWKVSFSICPIEMNIPARKGKAPKMVWQQWGGDQMRGNYEESNSTQPQGTDTWAASYVPKSPERNQKLERETQIPETSKVL